MGNERMLAAKYGALRTVLNERTRRLWAGTEAVAFGRGGIAAVMRVTGLSRNTIVRGIREMADRSPPGHTLAPATAALEVHLPRDRNHAASSSASVRASVSALMPVSWNMIDSAPFSAS